MDDLQRRKQIQARRKRKVMRQKRRIRNTILLVFALLIAFLAFLIFWKPVKKDVQLEVGSELTLEQFLKKEGAKASFVTDVDEIDTTVLGEHKVVVKVSFRKFKSRLSVVDTTAPTAEAADVKALLGTVPKAEDCVLNVKDMTEVTIAYKEEPDVSKVGETKAIILLTDAAGNTAEVNVPVEVWADEEPPIITGVKTKEVTVGGTVSYRQGVTVSDNMDEKPELTIDNSAVDLDKVGCYEIIYTAVDDFGNTTSVTGIVNVIPKETTPANVDEATVMDLAQDILANITNDSMSEREVAFAIYKWVNSSIGYVGTSDKSSWLGGAYQAFTKKTGDCYNYFAAAKALFKAAGIENIDVVKSDTSHSRHYWSLINLGTGWYHLDCTPRKGDGDYFFMVTDAELEAYSVAHENSHIFDKSAYPERATQSIQSEITY